MSESRAVFGSFAFLQRMAVGWRHGYLLPMVEYKPHSTIILEVAIYNQFNFLRRFPSCSWARSINTPRDLVLDRRRVTWATEAKWPVNVTEETFLLRFLLLWQYARAVLEENGSHRYILYLSTDSNIYLCMCVSVCAHTHTRKLKLSVKLMI